MARQFSVARRSQVARELADVQRQRESWGPNPEDWRATWADASQKDGE